MSKLKRYVKENLFKEGLGDRKRKERSDKFKKMSLDDKIDYLDGISVRPTRLPPSVSKPLDKISDIINDKGPKGLSKSDLKMIDDLVKDDMDLD